jgi:hypothetical protein
MAVTTDSLVYEWVGKRAAGITSHTNADVARATWYASVGSLNITLSNFDWSATDGWAGAGSVGDPYCLHADGSVHQHSTTATSAAWQDTSFSLEMWICPEAWVPGSAGAWFTNVGAAGYGFRIYTASTANGISLAWGYNGVASNYYTIVNPFTPSTWYHMVLTYNGSNIYTYWNNAQTSQGADTYSPNTTTEVAPFFGNADYNDPSHGSIATTRWYSKALSVAEVAANYAAGVTAASTDPAAIPALVVTRRLQG